MLGIRQAGHRLFTMPHLMSTNNATTTPTPAPPVRWIVVAFTLIYALDQVTKFLVTKSLVLWDESIVVDGFFRLVHWGNTGASWSLFWGNNTVLAIVAAGAFIALIFTRKHFNTSTLTGQLAFGMIMAGIAGNLTDRLIPSRHHVVDFLRFYVNTATGEVGFPAFNVADSGICVGVALLFWVTWKTESKTGVADSELKADGKAE